MLKVSLLRILAGATAGAVVIAGLFWLGLKIPKASGAIITAGVTGLWGYGWITFFREKVISVRSEQISRVDSPWRYWAWFLFYTVVGVYILAGAFYLLLLP